MFHGVIWCTTHINVRHRRYDTTPTHVIIFDSVIFSKLYRCQHVCVCVSVVNLTGNNQYMKVQHEII
jgi:hypothetical protein